MREGDVVVMLDHGKVLYVVRFLEDRGYTFLGEWFVTEIMNSEMYGMVKMMRLERWCLS